MEPFELDDAEWYEVLEVINTEARTRRTFGDFMEMTLLFKKLWKVIMNKNLRQQHILHAKHLTLKNGRSIQNKRLVELDREITKLPKDPGPVVG